MHTLSMNLHAHSHAVLPFQTGFHGFVVVRTSPCVILFPIELIAQVVAGVTPVTVVTVVNTVTVVMVVTTVTVVTVGQ